MTTFFLGIVVICLVPFIWAAAYFVDVTGPAWLATRVGTLFVRILTLRRIPEPYPPPLDLIAGLVGAALIGVAMVAGILLAVVISR